MSIPRPTEDVVGKAEHNSSLILEYQTEATSSSSGSRSRSDKITSSDVLHQKSKLEESDEDLFTVPDVEARPHADATILDKTTSVTTVANTPCHNNSELQYGKRLRGRNPADKEYRRLKRLLRNRVSAQQARERKKVYVNDLESRAKDLHDINLKLEEKISTLINENTMLRKVLMNTRPKVDESSEPK